MANLFEPGVRRVERAARVRAGGARCSARQAGGERLGASLFELPPGEALYPLHYHLGNEELLIVDRRLALAADTRGERVLERGEVVAFPRGEAGAHQVVNRSEAEARVLLSAR